MSRNPDYAIVEHFQEVAGIYAIVNTTDNKMYIGKSNNIKDRFKRHIRSLNLGRRFQGGYDLLVDWKTGKDFDFIILDSESSAEKEEHWIMFYNSHNSGYNNNIGSKRSETFKTDMRKIKNTKESKEKTSFNTKQLWANGTFDDRNTSGERNPKAKITNQQVREIKALIRHGIRPSDISRLTGVGQCTISHISSGRQWMSVE